MDNRKKKRDIRLIFQGIWTFVSNSYLIGFAEGKIYQGKLKNICLPGLNCYSCPGALGACPVGALQSFFRRTLWQDKSLCQRLSDFCGSAYGKICMRMVVPLRSCSGFAE